MNLSSSALVDSYQRRYYEAILSEDKDFLDSFLNTQGLLLDSRESNAFSTLLYPSDESQKLHLLVSGLPNSDRATEQQM